MRQLFSLLAISFLSAISYAFGTYKIDGTDSTAKSSYLIINQQQAGDNVDKDYLVKIGDVAPDFDISFPDGKKVKLSSLRGKVVMLQFTASWCGVCRKEMPYIEKDIWLKHKNNSDFVLFGIDREEPIEKINELRKFTAVTYPIGLDPKGDIFGLYAKKEAGITRNVIIDKDGKIILLTRLFKENEFGNMVKTIDELLSH